MAVTTMESRRHEETKARRTMNDDDDPDRDEHEKGRV
jgi:hypothetical protein